MGDKLDLKCVEESRLKIELCSIPLETSPAKVSEVMKAEVQKYKQQVSLTAMWRVINFFLEEKQ